MGSTSGRNKDRDIRLSETQMRHPGMEIAATRVADSDSETPDLAEEYRYVIKDLSRIGVIAVVMLGVLVGLALLV